MHTADLSLAARARASTAAQTAPPAPHSASTFTRASALPQRRTSHAPCQGAERHPAPGPLHTSRPQPPLDPRPTHTPPPNQPHSSHCARAHMALRAHHLIRSTSVALFAALHRPAGQAGGEGRGVACTLWRARACRLHALTTTRPHTRAPRNATAARLAARTNAVLPPAAIWQESNPVFTLAARRTLTHTRARTQPTLQCAHTHNTLSRLEHPHTHTAKGGEAPPRRIGQRHMG